MSDYCIKKALASLEYEAMNDTLFQLAERKWPTLRQTTIALRRQALTRYLLQKGYTMSQVKLAIDKLLQETS